MKEIPVLNKEGHHRLCPFRFKQLSARYKGVAMVGRAACMSCYYNTGILVDRKPMVVQCRYDEKHGGQ